MKKAEKNGKEVGATIERGQKGKLLTVRPESKHGEQGTSEKISNPTRKIIDT